MIDNFNLIDIINSTFKAWALVNLNTGNILLMRKTNTEVKNTGTLKICNNFAKLIKAEDKCAIVRVW